MTQQPHAGCVVHGLAHPCEACAETSTIEQHLISLAGSNPANDPVPGREHSEARLRAAYVRQQPSPVPDQLAIVWRLDIGRLLADLTHKRAFFDMHTKKDGAGIAGQAAPTVEPRPLGCALAMRVMQSDLYKSLDDTQRADCDELVQRNLEWFRRDTARGGT